MRALLMEHLTGPDGIRVVEMPEPSADGGILISVGAIGVRFADLLQSQGLYQERLEPPYVPFDEFAGTVLSAAGSTRWRAGDRVAGRIRGAGAEKIVADPADLLRLPSAFSFEEGAASVLNYRTALFGLEVRGRLVRGEVVLVHGAGGGTGTAALQVAKAIGSRTIGVVSTDVKARIAERAGADHVVRVSDDWKAEVLRLTGDRGVDVVWDPVGGDRATDNLRILAPGGRWIVVGFASGQIPEVALNRILLRNVDVVGMYFSGYMATHHAKSRELHDRLEAMLSFGQLRPIIGSVHRFEDASGALRELAERHAAGKVVITLP